MARGRGNSNKRKAKGSTGLNKKASADFLDKNRTKPGVFETESGLQILVIEEGDGPMPTEQDCVTVQQRITLVDGTIIADTYKQPSPATFTISEAIDGIREGLLMMKTGSRYRFFISPDLAWGKRGAGNKIGPHATLIFDVRLLKIE